MAAMDEVDQQQQREIEALRRVDTKHDTEFVFLRVAAIMIILGIVGIFATMIVVLDKASHPQTINVRLIK